MDLSWAHFFENFGFFRTFPMLLYPKIPTNCVGYNGHLDHYNINFSYNNLLVISSKFSQLFIKIIHQILLTFFNTTSLFRFLNIFWRFCQNCFRVSPNWGSSYLEKLLKKFWKFFVYLLKNILIQTLKIVINFEVIFEKLLRKYKVVTGKIVRKCESNFWETANCGEIE